MSANFPDPMEQMRKQQEQIRRQQEQARQQQEQLHRQQQEQIKRQQQVTSFYQQQQAAGKREASQSALDEKFARVEAEVARLQAERASGRLSEEQFKARLKELMLQDEQAQWWMVGADTGGWYRYDGSNWVQAVPPGRGVGPAASAAVRPLPSRAYPRPYPQQRRHPGWAVLIFILGMALVIFLGFQAARFGPNLIRPDMWGEVRATWELICAGSVWVVGLVLVLLASIRIGKGR